MIVINLFRKNRCDCFVIWGHGIGYLNEIIEDIRDHDSFDIMLIQKHEIGNIKKLVNKIYSFDYAPLFHLKAKVKYLKCTPPTVCFIFLKNTNVVEEYFGKGDFRHKECLKIKAFKDKIRVKFNPRTPSGELTHDHVIHATDNESQTDSILKLLGYKSGVMILKKVNKIIQSPHYIVEPDQFEIKQVPLDDIYCTNVFQKEGRQLIERIPISESVQYQAIESPKLYEDYLEQFKGGALKQDYNIKKYLLMKEGFVYLSAGFTTDFVIVEKLKDNGKFIIVDGLHRAAIHLNQGNLKITVSVF